MPSKRPKPKYHTPERGRLTVNGRRQHFEEDLSYYTELVATIARYLAVYRMEQLPDLAEHIDRLEHTKRTLYQDMVKTWWNE